jgi:L-2-hydroxyglutarate oxidase LhgO
MTERVDVVVVGGGILGLAAARSLLRTGSHRDLVVLEREHAVGQHQSSHNSGVLHAGVYYQPGSLKAQLCREGKSAMERYCAERGIAVVRNGKLVVAVDDSELPRLDALTERARANGVAGLRVLRGDELREVEPNVAGVGALHSPSTAVVDFGTVCRVLAGELPDVRLGVDVGTVENRSGLVHVDTSAGVIEARHAIVCAGLWSERMAPSSELRIVPFRGAWLALRPRAADLVRGNVYPVPDPTLPFLGVHVTRRVDGTVWAGPNAVLSLSQPRLLARALRFGGTWRMFAHHWRTGASEMWRDQFRRAYVRQVTRYLPALTVEDVYPGPRPSGVRAQAIGRDGTLLDDFVLDVRGRVVHVLNAPSPAATSAFAIADRIAGVVAGPHRS